MPAPRGPLRVHPANPRYFTDGSGRAVYLTGSHTWGNLCDYPPTRWPPFDYAGYLDLLRRYGHSFIRLWAGDSIECSPCRYVRSGPGLATDGLPRVDVTRLNPEYFRRLRERVATARDRGLYVGIMLFHADMCKPSVEEQDAMRRAMGHTLAVARRVDLAAMVPRGDLASSSYCLAAPGREYLVYAPDGGDVTVDLAGAQGHLAVEWIHADQGTVRPAGPVPGGTRCTFRAPFAGAAVLHLGRASRDRRP